MVVFSVSLSNVNSIIHTVFKHRPWQFLGVAWGSHDLRLSLPGRTGMASHRAHQAPTCSHWQSLPQNREEKEVRRAGFGKPGSSYSIVSANP